MIPLALARSSRILRELARIGLVRKSQFTVEFWFQVLMDCLWYASHVGVFEVLYSHADQIAGWKREDMRVLLGFLFVSDAFMMIWLSQMWRFGRDLKDGKLDPFRVRPAPPLLLYGFQLFSPEGCVNMLVALSYLAYGISVAVEITPWVVITALLAVLLSFWVRVVVVTLFSLLELFLLGSDATRFLHDVFHATSDRPIDVLGTRARLFLLYVVPVGALTQLPASIVLGHYTAFEAALSSAWLIGLGLLVFVTWSRSLRRYESALG